ncbi:GNAT family N-acetyltransferase [Rhabdaerophilum sp. SD176]|uniref:GNAT family N-acetyltransferase n=1 Tax=Rhabdaerophilum sp. SD176 TaxID=2983548 RepID=UPI0024DFDEAB|nr:GNAT family N-acetyltransferase [Rhabdaerophilum sp. SD176]
MVQEQPVVEGALAADLPALVQILAEDEVGGKGDAWTNDLAPGYRAAFEAILANPDHRVIVARHEGRVLGFVHLYFLRGLPSHGRLKVVLNSVFVAAAARGMGVGARLVAAAEAIARQGGATEVTLTSGKKRVDAHRFYRNLGYEQRHEGFGKALAGQ